MNIRSNLSPMDSLRGMLGVMWTSVNIRSNLVTHGFSERYARGNVDIRSVVTWSPMDSLRGMLGVMWTSVDDP